MMKKKFCLSIVFLLSAIITLAQTGHDTYGLNFKAGIMMPGMLYVEDVDFDTKISPVFKADFDAILMPKFSTGICLMFTPLSVEDFDSPFKILTVSATLKTRFRFTGGSQLRPGLAIGFNHIGNSDMDNPINGLNLGLQIEYAQPLSNKIDGLAEIGFISQPVGGNDDVTASFPPKIFLTFGIEFGK